MSERKGARDAIDRLAGRVSTHSERTGRKLTHDQAKRIAREAAKRHDRRKD